MALTLTTIHIAIMFVAAAVFVVTAVSDIRTYRIPNLMCGLLFFMFPLFVATSPHTIQWAQNTVVFAVVSLAGFALFLSKGIGAGDIKLLSVTSLWAGPDLIAVLLLVTTFIGGIESIIMGIALYLKRPKIGAPWNPLQEQVPYGVAIATGGLVMLGKMAQPFWLPG